MTTTATWREFAEAAPEMARLGAALLDHHGIAYIATTRADGSPRLHPVSPFFVDDWLVVATPPTSPKVRDQLRDPRVVIHALPGKDDAEFRIRARARPIVDPAARARVRELGPHFVREDDAYFDYRIEEAHTARWVKRRPARHVPRTSVVAADGTSDQRPATSNCPQRPTTNDQRPTQPCVALTACSSSSSSSGGATSRRPHGLPSSWKSPSAPSIATCAT